MKKLLKKKPHTKKTKKKKLPVPTPGGPWCFLCNGPCKDICEA